MVLDAMVTARFQRQAHEEEVVVPTRLAVCHDGSGIVQGGLDISAGEKHTPARLVRRGLVEGVVIR